ncbi:MAG: type II secretion system F family protein [Anaerohalosphaeraceae bacterium]|nr:type II secretion system F family protein [Anaerohalosphaeraceae bacterium]
MTAFQYEARDEKGDLFIGVYEDVRNLAELRDELCKIGYKLVSAKKRKNIKATLANIKQAEVVEFAYKFAGMSSAGLSIIQCLETLEKQTENEALKSVITDIKRKIELGMSLTDAFDTYRKIFSDFFLGMLEAGESGGKLAESLEISAKYLEKRADMKNKLKAAFTYPIVVSVLCVVIITILIVFIVPVFSKIYSQLGVALPGPTQVLIILSYIMRNYWSIILGIIVAAPFAIHKLRKNAYVRAKWDIFKFKVPVFGKLNRMVTVSNFIRSFAMLSSTGVPIIKALQISSLVAHNWQLSEISNDIQQSIQAGTSVAESMQKHALFPPIIIQLANTGEEAGTLGAMLNKGVDFLEKDIERSIARLMVKLEPILTLSLGLIIGVILMAVYLPMFDYMTHLK